MLLIIGGAARTGKGILSRRLLTTLHQPYLSLDVVKMGIVNGLPTFGLNPESSAVEIANGLWPLVRAMAVNMLETDVHYTLEGEILPHHADELARRFPGQVRACFLGYAEIDVSQKLREIREFGGHPNDWTTDCPEDELGGLIHENIAFSRSLREQCGRFPFPYFDTSANFEGVLNDAEAYLLHGEPYSLKD